MKRKSLLLALAAAALMLTPVTAGAATVTTQDGVISIETPNDSWAQTADPNYWFVITDGKSSITIDHFSNGESLPAVTVASDSYPAVTQSFFSTKNEVFVVKGMAHEQADLAEIMKAIGSIQILRYDTKTALPATTAAPTISSFGIREINDTYYITTNDLQVRTECSIDSTAIGSLNTGDQVKVKGMVTKDGQDYGWYQIEYNGATAFISAQYASKTAPSTSSANTSQSSSSSEKYAVANGFTAYDSNGNNQGQLVLYSDGLYYSNDMVSYRANGDGTYTSSMDTLYDYNPVSDLVPCEYCGEYFHAGNDYRNHVMAAHSGSGSNDDDLVQCQYCGEYFHAGNDYRNHVMAAHSDTDDDDDDDDDDLVQCQFCGEYFHAGNDYRNHVMAAHPDAYDSDDDGGL